MKEGLSIGSKVFKFLHYSSSQIKAHSCWFFCEEEIKYQDVMNSLGNFESEKKVEKNAARKGQAFSSAIKVATLDLNTEVEQIPDITSGDYVFSDGCGEVSPQLAKEIARRYGVCFWWAFQIRMGGYKGVLFVSDNFGGKAKVRVRPSMKKFDVNSEDKTVDLEVIRMATYSPGYLNKQIISILWANGVGAEVFLDMQKEYVQRVWEDYDTENLNHNLKYLSALSSSVNMISSKIRKASSQGIDMAKDPFILPLVKLVNYNKFSEIRKRFRIFDEQCWVLVGVIDPYGCLEEGEVFVQFCKNVPTVHSKGTSTKKELIEGKIIVSRNPWVHPGDVRILKAVRKSEFKDYWNVIVFSSKGERPEQDKMASGDLDGDIYWINWRPDFIDNFIEQPPWTKKEPELPIQKPFSMFNFSDYSESDSDDEEIIYYTHENSKQEELTKNEFQREDYIRNFINYIKNDYLGEVANLHSKIADSDRSAISSEECLELAEMHSKAVDYQKHGELLNVYKFEKIKNKNFYFVDFMSYNKKNIRKDKIRESPGVLGQMFRDLQMKLNQEELIELEYKLKIQRDYCLPDYLFEDTEFLMHLEFVYANIVKPYNEEIQNLMYEKSLWTESDIFNTNCAFSNIVSARDEVYSHRHEIEMILTNIEEIYITEVVHPYKNSFKGTKNFNRNLNKAIHFASYFDLVHANDPRLKPFFKIPSFSRFYDMIFFEEQKSECIQSMTLNEFKKIMTCSHLEEDEITRVIGQTKILSAWWFLTR
jgi:hypothetical protein